MAKNTVLLPLDQHIAQQAPVVAETPKSHKKEQALQAPVVATPKIVPFRIIDNVRPQRGTPLFSFTQAWMEMTGLLEGKAADRAQVSKLAGSSMVNYHFSKGNFEMRKDGLALTVEGLNKFKARMLPDGTERPDPKLVEAFKAILTHGKMDGTLVKNQTHIKPM